MTDVLAGPARAPLLVRSERACEAERQAREAQDAEYRAQRREQEEIALVRHLKAAFDVDVPRDDLQTRTVEIQGESTYIEPIPVAVIDGLTFARDDYNGGLCLVRPCPKCERLVLDHVPRLVDLIGTVESPVSHYRCPAHQGKTVPTPAPIAPTVEQRLLSALKDLIAQEVPNGEG